MSECILVKNHMSVMSVRKVSLQDGDLLSTADCTPVNDHMPITFVKKSIWKADLIKRNRSHTDERP